MDIVVNFKTLDELYCIAEIGINHNGDIGITKKLIDASFATSWDCVKFQKRNPDVCVPDHQKDVMRDTPWGRMTYLEYKHKVEFGKEEYDEIDSYCKQQKIAWSASPWDMDSVEFLEQYNLPFIKIPSAMLTNDELITACVERFPKVIFSTGMSTAEEIDHAVDTLRIAKSYYNKTDKIGEWTQKKLKDDNNPLLYSLKFHKKNHCYYKILN